MKFKYQCIDCGKTYITDEALYLCPKCAGTEGKGEFPKGYLRVLLNKRELRKIRRLNKTEPQDFFPYKIPTPDVYPIGNTPLIKPRRLNSQLGIQNIKCKMDSQLPSGSFKDRASQLIVGQANALHTNKIALASTGNAGAAMSCAGAAYGLDIILFVPESAPKNKLMQSVLYGATVGHVKGTYDDAFKLSIEYTKHFGGINRNTAYNPMTIEGKKAISIELFEQYDRHLPDVIYVPVGDGCIISGVYKGFCDLKQAKLIKKIPYIVCCQSIKSNAISRAFKTGIFKSVKASTRADSISVDIPASGRMAVQYLKKYKGWCTEVNEKQILDAQLSLAKEAGIFVEPASCAAWAALVKDKKLLIDRFGANVNVCVLLTGTGFKDMSVFDDRITIPEAIDNSSEAMIKRFS